MEQLSYLNLNRHPVQLSIRLNRSDSFQEIFHAHQGLEILYVHEGSGRAIVERQAYLLKPGTLLYFKPLQLHQIQMDIGPDQPYIRSMLLFEPSVMLDYLRPYPGLSAFLSSMWKDQNAVQCMDGVCPEEMNAILSSCETRIAADSSRVGTEEAALMMASLLHYIKTQYDKRTPQSKKALEQLPEAVVQIMMWIEEHYSEEFQLPALAEHIHLSPNHVSYLFHKETGSTISDYLAARRMKQACYFLKKTPLPVQEIGQRIGMLNFSYFCQWFKKIQGVSPSKYRAS